MDIGFEEYNKVLYYRGDCSYPTSSVIKLLNILRSSRYKDSVGHAILFNTKELRTSGGSFDYDSRIMNFFYDVVCKEVIAKFPDHSKIFNEWTEYSVPRVAKQVWGKYVVRVLLQLHSCGLWYLNEFQLPYLPSLLPTLVWTRHHPPSTSASLLHDAMLVDPRISLSTSAKSQDVLFSSSSTSMSTRSTTTVISVPLQLPRNDGLGEVVSYSTPSIFASINDSTTPATIVAIVERILRVLTLPKTNRIEGDEPFSVQSLFREWPKELDFAIDSRSVISQQFVGGHNLVSLSSADIDGLLGSLTYPCSAYAFNRLNLSLKIMKWKENYIPPLLRGKVPLSLPIIEWFIVEKPTTLAAVPSEVETSSSNTPFDPLTEYIVNGRYTDSFVAKCRHLEWCCDISGNKFRRVMALTYYIWMNRLPPIELLISRSTLSTGISRLDAKDFQRLQTFLGNCGPYDLIYVAGDDTQFKGGNQNHVLHVFKWCSIRKTPISIFLTVRPGIGKTVDDLVVEDLATILASGAPLQNIAGGISDHAATPEFKSLGIKIHDLSPLLQHELKDLEDAILAAGVKAFAKNAATLPSPEIESVVSPSLPSPFLPVPSPPLPPFSLIPSPSPNIPVISSPFTPLQRSLLETWLESRSIADLRNLQRHYDSNPLVVFLVAGDPMHKLNLITQEISEKAFGKNEGYDSNQKHHVQALYSKRWIVKQSERNILAFFDNLMRGNGSWSNPPPEPVRTRWLYTGFAADKYLEQKQIPLPPPWLGNLFPEGYKLLRDAGLPPKITGVIEKLVSWNCDNKLELAIVWESEFGKKFQQTEMVFYRSQIYGFRAGFCIFEVGTHYYNKTLPFMKKVRKDWTTVLPRTLSVLNQLDEKDRLVFRSSLNDAHAFGFAKFEKHYSFMNESENFFIHIFTDGRSGSCVRAATTALRTYYQVKKNVSIFPTITFKAVILDNALDQSFVKQFATDILIIDSLFHRFGFFDPALSDDLAALSKNLVFFQAATDDLLTKDFRSGKSDLHELYERCCRAIAPFPATNVISELTYSQMKALHRHGETHEIADQRIRYFQNIQHENNLEQLELVAHRKNNTKVADSPDQLLLDIVHVKDDIAPVYDCELMTDIPTRSSFRGYLTKTDQSHAQRFVGKSSDTKSTSAKEWDDKKKAALNCLTQKEYDDALVANVTDEQRGVAVVTEKLFLGQDGRKSIFWGNFYVGELISQIDIISPLISSWICNVEAGRNKKNNKVKKLNGQERLGILRSFIKFLFVQEVNTDKKKSRNAVLSYLSPQDRKTVAVLGLRWNRAGSKVQEVIDARKRIVPTTDNLVDEMQIGA